MDNPAFKLMWVCDFIDHWSNKIVANENIPA